LFSDDERWPFSFVNVCRALGLEPGHLRRRLTQWRQCPPAAPRRRQRHTIRSRFLLRAAA
jgi:hypothetical protein